MFRRSCSCLRSSFFLSCPPRLSVFLLCTASLLSTGKDTDTQAHRYKHTHTHTHTGTVTVPCVICYTVFLWHGIEWSIFVEMITEAVMSLLCRTVPSYRPQWYKLLHELPWRSQPVQSGFEIMPPDDCWLPNVPGIWAHVFFSSRWGP